MPAKSFFLTAVVNATTFRVSENSRLKSSRKLLKSKLDIGIWSEEATLVPLPLLLVSIAKSMPCRRANEFGLSSDSNDCARWAFWTFLVLAGRFYFRTNFIPSLFLCFVSWNFGCAVTVAWRRFNFLWRKYDFFDDDLHEQHRLGSELLCIKQTDCGASITRQFMSCKHWRHSHYSYWY